MYMRCRSLLCCPAPPSVPAGSGGRHTVLCAAGRSEAVPSPHDHLPWRRTAQVCSNGCLITAEGLQGKQNLLHITSILLMVIAKLMLWAGIETY